ncbi:MAG: RNA methyltransferase, TrmH family, group 3 [Candidatus Tokpelaia hoelldobleri]|uniref:RNA methyltransferase, TrmH family, group 3 n=1 Tax=Candidatus Tokpelaia hoelldobleri TaxID=1902579 RepID=A0A1U9JTN8_9HYPH|nr:MAG: RNA methyltransferase, TrmH family, group 3 [Candidatus Tokpelaia hoelldoblerii]
MSQNTPKDSHYARLRRQHRAAKGGESHHVIPRRKTLAPAEVLLNRLWLYGLHTVAAALDNPRRVIHRLLVTRNAWARLSRDEAQLPCAVEFVESRLLEQMLGSEAVHQGVMIETEALAPRPLTGLHETPLVVVLDQITDPHNVGAIMRSAVALGAGALVTTARHSPQESGVLAKAASGALELVDHITVRNLAEALETLHTTGFQTVGLDSAGEQPLEPTFRGQKIALVLGAEGKGLRQKTRQTVIALARLDMPGVIKSLNVSNAAAIALYLARSHIDRQERG